MVITINKTDVTKAQPSNVSSIIDRAVRRKGYAGIKSRGANAIDVVDETGESCSYLLPAKLADAMTQFSAGKAPRKALQAFVGRQHRLRRY